jgi:hypothetical protein
MKRSTGMFPNRLEHLDRAFVAYLERHLDLLLAILAAGLVLWAIATRHAGYVPEVCAVGAVSFFIGFLPSLGVALALTIWRVTHLILVVHAVDASSVMMEVFGYGCVAWLGFRHREAQRRQKEQRESVVAPVAGSVIPWAVANEIRSSLAAVRFLLFPLQTKAEKTEGERPIEQATAELSRLEALFNQLASSKQDT